MKGIKRIAVIGGGASGALLILQLVRSRISDAEICLFEPCEDLGRGVAYEKKSEILLLNTPAEKMSCREEDPLHFVDWIKGNRKDLLRSSNYPFVPRSVYGDYLEEQLNSILPSFRRIPFAVNTLKVGEAGEIEITFGERKENFDFCCVATGYGISKKSLIVNQLRLASRQNPDELNILGSGLSSIDTWMLLREFGYQGKIHFYSTSGEFPLPHKEECSEIPDFRFVVGKSPRDLFQNFKNELRLGKYSLQDLADGIRKSGKEIWASWGESERRSFLFHLRSRWQKIRHRVPPKVHRALCQELLTGKITIQKVSKEFRLRINDRKDFFYTTGYAPECSPFSFDLSILEASKFGLGVDSKLESLEVLGPLRAGKDWESNSIPEIRQKAAEITKEWKGRIEKSHLEQSRWLTKESNY